MNKVVFKHIRPFNTAVELGLRSLHLLAAAAPKHIDLQRLCYLDYLLVHSGDVTDGPASLHAPVPNRGGEWLIKRQLLELGLNMMVARELLAKQFELTGISYSATDLTVPFLEHLKSEYAKGLWERAEWLEKTFASMELVILEEFMVRNLRKWGAEYSDSIFRGGRDE